MEPRIPRDKAAALHILGPLKENPYIKPFVHPALDGGWIDFNRMIEAESFQNLSTGEQLLVDLAAQAYKGVGIAAVAAHVDEPSWVRVIEGLTIMRGLEDGMSITPGQWVDGVIA